MAANGRRKAPTGSASPSGSSLASLPSSLTPRSLSLPHLQTLATPGHEVTVSGASGGASGSAVTKCRGEFCRLPPSSLVGLYGSSTENNAGDGVDDGPDDVNATSRRHAVSRDRHVVLVDDGRRFKIGNNNLLLAKAEMGFITGTTVGAAKDQQDAVLQWQVADNVHRMELGRGNPSVFYKQVSVCRNCHRIYADLASFRELGFRWDARQRDAWNESSEKPRVATKKKTKAKDGAGEKRRVGGGLGKEASPEDEASLQYDRLFLAELAKHSEIGEPSQWQQPQDGSARLENDGGCERTKYENSPRASVDALPTLKTPVTVNEFTAKKKKVPNILRGDETAVRVNNQQLVGMQSGRESKVDGDADVAAVIQLEKVVHQLREELTREQARSKSVEAQKQLLEQRLAHVQVAIQEREHEFRKKLLEVELDAVGKKMGGAGHEGKTNPTADVGDLIETIDSLNVQLHEMNNDKEKLRREMLQTHQLEVKRLHEKYQVEMETLRLSEYTAKEQADAAHMQMTQWQNDVQVATSQAKNAKAALDELIRNKVPLLEEKNQRLEKQVAELKAKVSTNSGGGSASSTTLAQDIAAIEKHLNNKIEYLKAQLASEMKCKEELGSHLAGITASIELLKKEKRVALNELEDAHKRHIERLESNFAQEKETLCAQGASFQGKIAMLQANVTDLVQELTLWKSKEANGRLAIDKLAEENVRLTRQIVDLESSVEALQEERKRDGTMSAKNASDETQRMQMEALLRRLDNERQYLKNQVDNEADLKTQNQQKAHSLEEELQELKIATEEMTKIAEHKISSLNAEKANLERHLRDETAAFDDSKNMLTRQLKDLQVKLLQAKEQSLLEKDELEKGRIEVNEARSQLLAAREETLKEKEYGKSANDRMSKALATIKTSLKAMEEEKNLRIRRLEEEATMYMQKLAKTQGELLVLETKWSEEKEASRRQQAIQKFVWILTHRMESRHLASKSAAFWQVRCASAIEASRTTLLAAHQRESTRLEEEVRRNFMEKCDELTQTLHAERTEALEHADALREREKDELRQYFEQERSQLEEDLRHLHRQEMHELEEQYDHTIKSVDEQSAAALSALQTRCDELQQERDEARAAFAETRTRCEQIGASAEEKDQAVAAQLLESQKMWESKVKALENTHKARSIDLENAFELRLRDLTSRHKEESTQLVSETEARHETELDQLRADLELKAVGSESRLLDQHREDVRAREERHSHDLDQEKEQLNLSWQRELDRERARHEKTLKEALARVEAKTQGHLEDLQKDMNDRKATALLQCTGKWQKAMEELQARLDTEKKVAYESGLQDRENEWQQAALQIKQKQKEELANVQNEAIRAIQAAEERHKMLMEAKLAQMRMEFEERQKTELARLQSDIIATEKAKSQIDLEAALLQQKEDLGLKHRQEVENLREELVDDHQADMDQLKMCHKMEKDELALSHGRERELLSQKLEQEFTTKFDQLRNQNESDIETRFAEQESKLIEELEHSRVQMREVFETELESKLKEQEKRLLSEQEEAINQVQEDSERLIEQVEVAMTELKKQKDALENELTRLRGALEEAEDAHFDTEENLKKQQKAMMFHIMALVMHAKKTLEKEAQRHTQQLMELQAKHDCMGTLMQRDKRDRERELEHIRETWSRLQSRHGDMLQTLTNYKRDELVAHRSAGAVLSNEVSIVTKQMDEVTDMKAVLEKDIEQLQAEAQGIEASLRQLMLQSSSSSASGLSGANDGGLNMAVVAKKRRLNEEFESLLEQMERKKGEVRNMDKTLASLRQRRDEKESELKSMERKLVEILVGQQKQMLTLLNATREIAPPSALTTVSAG